VQAAVHGDEPGGTAAVIRVLQRVAPDELRGAVVLVPAVNIPGFVWQRRNTPLDLENLNRLFPGNPTGSLSHRLAVRLWETIRETADVLMDLHSGGAMDKVPFYAIFHANDTAASREAERLARAAGSHLIWASQEAWLRGALATVATEADLPAIIVECGGGDVSETDVSRYEDAVMSVMRALGMLDGEPLRLDRYLYVSRCDFVYAGEAGLFIPEAQLGEVCAPEQRWGRLVTLYGDTAETFTSPEEAVLLALRGAYRPVSSGDFVAEVATGLRWVGG